MLSIGDSLFPEKFPYKSEWFAGIRDQESFLQRSAVLPPQACVLPLYVASSAAYNYFWTFRDFPALLCGYTLHKFPQCRKLSSFHESDLRKYAGSYPQIFLCVQYTFLLYLRQLPVCLSFCRQPPLTVIRAILSGQTGTSPAINRYAAKGSLHE